MCFPSSITGVGNSHRPGLMFELFVDVLDLFIQNNSIRDDDRRIERQSGVLMGKLELR